MDRYQNDKFWYKMQNVEKCSLNLNDQAYEITRT